MLAVFNSINANSINSTISTIDGLGRFLGKGLYYGHNILLSDQRFKDSAGFTNFTKITLTHSYYSKLLYFITYLNTRSYLIIVLWVTTISYGYYYFP